MAASADVQVPFSEVEKLTVLSEAGEAVEFGSLFAREKAIIIFVRHFLWYVCKEYVEDLAKVPAAHLQGVRLVVVGCAPHDCIGGFRKETGYTQELYCDPQRVVYKALGLATVIGGLGGHSAHVRSGVVMGTLRSAGRFFKSMRMQGDVTQQGGAYVLGPGSVVWHAHQDASPKDHADINVLLQAAGLPAFAFAAGAAARHDED